MCANECILTHINTNTKYNAPDSKPYAEPEEHKRKNRTAKPSSHAHIHTHARTHARPNQYQFGVQNEANAILNYQTNIFVCSLRILFPCAILMGIFFCYIK